MTDFFPFFHFNPVPLAVLSTDEFTGTSLNPQWTFVNPQGDASYSSLGSALRLIVPAGEHNWFNTDQAVKMVQVGVTGDWEVRARFVNLPPVAAGGGTVGWGLCCDNGSGDGVRTDFLRWFDGTTHTFTALCNNGSSTTLTNAAVSTTDFINGLYIRLVKSGTTYTAYYSPDGANWTASGSSFTWSGTPSRVGIHMVTSGTSQGFNADCDWFYVGASSPSFVIKSLSLLWNVQEEVEPPADEAPPGPYELGVQIGVPTGTVLTPTSGLPTPDAIEDVILTNPVTGEQNTLSCKVYRRRSWNATVQFSTGPGEHIYFDECLFSRTTGDPFYVIDITDTQQANNIMAPIAIFNRCTLEGHGTTGGCLSGDAIWFIRSQADGAADGWFDASYSVGIESNFFTNNDNPEAHTDCIQIPKGGNSIFWKCWADIYEGVNVNAALAMIADFGPITNVKVYYCGFAGGSFTVQGIGDDTNGITNVVFHGNRWTRGSFGNGGQYGPVSFDHVTGVTWTDNRFYDGEEIPNPSP